MRTVTATAYVRDASFNSDALPDSFTPDGQQPDNTLRHGHVRAKIRGRS